MSDETIRTATEIRACMLIYDIPEASELDNPSGILRRVAVRVNLSCWVIPEDRIPYGELQVLRDGGATWYVVPFDSRAAESYLELVRTSLNQQMREAIARLQDSMDSAEAKLDAIPETAVPTDREKGLKKFITAGKANLKRVEGMIRDLQAAAKVFGVSGQTPFTGCLASITGLRDMYHARAATYSNALAEAVASGATWVADADRAGDLPAGILADVLEDAGQDVSELREAFQGAPGSGL